MAEHEHWKLNFPSDYLGSEHLPEGKDLILKIKDVGREKVSGPNGEKKDRLIVYFDVKDIPDKFICNKTNAKTIAKVTGSVYLDDWVGKKIQLYSEMVFAFGTMQPALRVREFAPR
jgi:hypothetical protein